MTYIRRRLTVMDETGKEIEYSDSEFFALEAPLVVLGEPGAGKSILVETFAAVSNSKVYKPSDLQLSSSLGKLNLPARIIVDGLDEVTAYQPGTPITEVLSKINAEGHTNFVLTCRAVDWQHAINSSMINAHWQKRPVVGRLLPLDDQEIIDFVNANDGDRNGEDFLREARKRDVVDLLRNPQNLSMVLKTVAAYGWPDKKSELYERACATLIAEDNERHRSINRVRPAADLLLDTAGFICAQLLLSGAQKINVDGHSNSSTPTIAELTSDQFNNETVKFALSTKIFRIIGNDAVEPCHRTIAEYLAARWLAKNIGSQFTLNRLETLLYGHAFIVPSALRGLHAWLATLCPATTKIFITRDPYGFFRYGDPAMLIAEQARHLLQSLLTLAEIDPYFRSEDWHATFGRGLARPELRNDIITIIRDPKTPYQLTHLILESIQGNGFVKKIANDLLDLVQNKTLTPMERHAAVEALTESKVPVNWSEITKKLCSSPDMESLRLAIGIMGDNIEDFSGETIANALILLEKSLAEDGRNYVGIGYALPQKMSVEQLEDALRVLSQRAPDDTEYSTPRIEDANEWIFKFCMARLAQEAPPKPATLWSWVSRMDRFSHYRSEWDKFSRDYFLQHPELRCSIQAEALRQAPDAKAFWMALWHMGDAGGLWLHENDIITHLDNMLKENVHDEDWAQRWEHLVRWAKMNRDFTGSAVEHARKQAELYPELKVKLIELDRPPQEDAYEKKFKKMDEQRERRRKEAALNRHKNYEKISDALAAGKHLGALGEVANAYLGRYSDLKNDLPTENVKELVGEKIVPAAFKGIAAVATRDDIPTAKQMIELRAKENKHYFFESILLVHCATLLDNGQSLSQLPPNVAASALAACHWDVHFLGDKTTPDIQKGLEKIVFADPTSKTAFVRDTIEPFLSNETTEHISGLYRFARNEEFADISGDLSLEWLQRFPHISGSALEDLLLAAANCSFPEALIKLIRERVCRDTWKSEEQKGIWMGAAFLLDFDHHQATLSHYIGNDKTKLWPLRPDRREKHQPQLNAVQNHFLISAFGPLWPPVESPSSGWSGGENPWDASQCIQACITALAADLSDPAATLLKGLMTTKGLDGFQNQIKHVYAQQTRRRAEANKPVPSLSGVRNILLKGEPAGSADLQALIMDELESLQRRIKDGQTNGVEQFWINNRPQDENYCRNRIVEQLELVLTPFNTRCHVEGAMPDSNRCDFLNTHGQKNLPVEVKGQWHPEVWTAAAGQLQNYTRDYHSDGWGIYLVLWFGHLNTGDSRNPRGWKNQAAPQSAKEMKALLKEKLVGLPEKTKIFVLDVSRSQSVIHNKKASPRHSERLKSARKRQPKLRKPTGAQRRKSS